jgi:hypothetical protein
VSYTRKRVINRAFKKAIIGFAACTAIAVSSYAGMANSQASMQEAQSRIQEAQRAIAACGSGDIGKNVNIYVILATDYIRAHLPANKQAGYAFFANESTPNNFYTLGEIVRNDGVTFIISYQPQIHASPQNPAQISYNPNQIRFLNTQLPRWGSLASNGFTSTITPPDGPYVNNGEVTITKTVVRTPCKVRAEINTENGFVYASIDIGDGNPLILKQLSDTATTFQQLPSHHMPPARGLGGQSFEGPKVLGKIYDKLILNIVNEPCTYQNQNRLLVLRDGVTTGFEPESKH